MHSQKIYRKKPQICNREAKAIHILIKALVLKLPILLCFPDWMTSKKRVQAQCFLVYSHTQGNSAQNTKWAAFSKWFLQFRCVQGQIFTTNYISSFLAREQVDVDSNLAGCRAGKKLPTFPLLVTILIYIYIYTQ